MLNLLLYTVNKDKISYQNSMYDIFPEIRTMDDNSFVINRKQTIIVARNNIS